MSTNGEQAQDFRRLFALSQDLLCIASPDGWLLRVNPAWTRVLGWTEEELLSRPFTEFIHPDDIEPTLETVEEQVGGASIMEFQNRYRHKEGGWRWLSWNSQIADDGGLIYASARDVTPHVELHEALEIRQAELQRSNQDLEQFAYAASHDLQQPLRMIAGFSDLLVDEYGDRLEGDALDYLDRITGSARRMQAMVNDLLQYSRVGRRELHLESLDLSQILDDVCADLEGRLQDTGGSIEVGELPPVHADRTEVERVLRNLIDNALEFHGDSPPRVVVHGTIHDDGAHLVVRDHGIGIAPEHRERAFILFRRLHPGRSGSGTGMGLAIARTIVRRHGGRIWIAAPEDGGTAIHLTLPLPEGTPHA